MGMRGAGIHLQFAQLLATKGVLGKHASNGDADHFFWLGVQQLCIRTALEATWVTGVLLVKLLASLLLVQVDLVGVDDNDEVTSIDVWSKDRLVLAAKARSDLCGQTAEGEIGRINFEPGPGDVGRFGAEGLHESRTFRVVGKAAHDHSGFSEAPETGAN
jgi:hypothetical protein